MSSFCNVRDFNSGFLTGFWSSFAEFYLLVLLLSICCFFLLAYCLKGFGIYKMAKNRNFDNAYLAWFPFARYYLFGKISDDINKYKNIKSSNRVVLLVLSILHSVSIWVLNIFICISFAEFSGAAFAGLSGAEIYVTPLSEYLTVFLAEKINSFLIILTIIFIIWMMFTIFYCIYANNILKDYIPKLSGLMCLILILNCFMFSCMIVDSVIFLSICTNQPDSLRDSNKLI